jgi:hypothetical protein
MVGSVAVNEQSATYKLEPENPFRVSEIRSIVEHVVDEWCSRGCGEDITKEASMVSELVKDGVKNRSSLDRHKIVVQTYLYEYVGQSIRICSKCLWDGNFDNYVTVERDVWPACEDRRFTIVVIVFGLFFE